MSEFSELVARLQDDTSVYFDRVEAVHALGRSGVPEAVGHIVAALQDPEQYVRREAALVLGKLGVNEAVAPLARVYRVDSGVH